MVKIGLLRPEPRLKPWRPLGSWVPTGHLWVPTQLKKLYFSDTKCPNDGFMTSNLLNLDCLSQENIRIY